MEYKSALSLTGGLTLKIDPPSRLEMIVLGPVAALLNPLRFRKAAVRIRLQQGAGITECTGWHREEAGIPRLAEPRTLIVP